MKWKRRIIILLATLLCLTASFTAFAAEGMYVTRSDGNNGAIFEYYTGEYGENGNRMYLVNQWKQVSDKWFYFDDKGLSKQNTWAEIDGKWYYFDEWSVMQHDTTTPDGFYVDGDGACMDNNPIDTSGWLGKYVADDGQIITVTSVNTNDINITFKGYSEEGQFEKNYVLKYSNPDKTKAEFQDSNSIDKDIYVLNDNIIQVIVKPNGGWKQGTYVRQ